MRSVLFRCRGIEVYSHPAMVYLGLVAGIVAENYAAHLRHLDSWRVFVATLLLLIPTLAGMRLLFVATHWERYRRAPARIWKRSEGGAALFGALPFALLCSVPLLNLLALPFGAFWDVATITITIAMMFTRVGCLLNGCCGGRTTTSRLSLYLPDINGHWQRRIPTQLLEASWAGLLLLGIIVLWNRWPFPRAVFLFTLMGYGIGRFVFESLREEQDRLGRLSMHRWISAGLVAAALTLFLFAWRY